MNNIKHYGMVTSASHAPTAPVADLAQAVGYHIYTLYLFTADQFIDSVTPATAFAIMAAMSGQALNLPVLDTKSILGRIPLVALWVWVAVLQFCIHNQRGQDSIEEDGINKPWRPLPSNRITSNQAANLLMATQLVACLLSYRLGVLTIYVVYCALLFVYNDFGGADHSGIARNFLCATGFTCYFTGALEIALGPDASMSRQALTWAFMITTGVLTTTFHAQEFRDEAGDRARGRRTLVTEIGRVPAFWTLIVIVPLWSLYLPLWFFRTGWMAAASPVTAGTCLLACIMKAMANPSHKLDRQMYKLWSVWMFSLCPLPLMATSLIKFRCRESFR
jgi:4-hydroxybenzoate polyprenyltransferase